MPHSDSDYISESYTAETFNLQRTYPKAHVFKTREEKYGWQLREELPQKETREKCLKLRWQPLRKVQQDA